MEQTAAASSGNQDSPGGAPKQIEFSIKVAAGVVGEEARSFTLWYLIRDRPHDECDPVIEARWLFVHDVAEEMPPALTTMLYAHENKLEACITPWKKPVIVGSGSPGLLDKSISLGLQQCGTPAGPRLILDAVGDAVDDEEVVRKFYALVHKELGVVVATTEIE
jgi:hypothetical protein